jgi:CO/xanthine dehydrogenase FAD-binding subunit
MKKFDYYAPATVEEALSILKQKGPGGKLLAGGTDLLVQTKEGGRTPAYVVSLRRLKELHGIEYDTQWGLRVGALAEMAAVAAHPVVRQRYGALADGADIVGSVQTRNMATIGGNLCNAAPSADTIPALVVHAAAARIAHENGRREVPVEEFCTGPGRTVMHPQEVLLDVFLPKTGPRTGSAYARQTPRKEMDIAVVGVAVLVTLEPDADVVRDARVCLGAVAPTPIRSKQAEAALEGNAPTEEVLARAGAGAAADARPISDVRGTAAFRRYLCDVLTRRMVRLAVERARATPN